LTGARISCKIHILSPVSGKEKKKDVNGKRDFFTENQQTEDIVSFYRVTIHIILYIPTSTGLHFIFLVIHQV